MDHTQINQLVDRVTQEILRRMGDEPQQRAGEKRFLVLGKDPGCPVAACLNRDFTADIRPNLDDRHRYDFAVLPVWYLDKLTGKTPGGSAGHKHTAAAGATLDFTGKALIHERQLKEHYSASASTLRVDRRAIITALAADYIKKRGLTVERAD